MYARVHTILSISVGGAIVFFIHDDSRSDAWKSAGCLHGKPETGQKYSVTHRDHQNNGEIIFALSRRLMNSVDRPFRFSHVKAYELDIIILVSSKL